MAISRNVYLVALTFNHVGSIRHSLNALGEDTEPYLRCPCVTDCYFLLHSVNSYCLVLFLKNK